MLSRLTNTLRISLVLAFSLLLLLYVGYGEANKTYPAFQFDKFASLGDIVINPIETFLDAGLPLNQFPGFVSLTSPVLESEKAITGIGLTDKSGTKVFSNPPSSEGAEASFAPSTRFGKTAGYRVLENETFYRISMEVKSKFEEVGTIWMLCSREGIEGSIRDRFLPLLWAFAAILAAQGAMVFFAAPRRGERAKQRLNITYGVSFLLMSVLVILTLVQLYTEGILGKTEALADSLNHRLGKALELGLEISDFSRVEEVFREYRENNPETSFVAMTVNDRVVIHSDPGPGRLNRPLKPDADEFHHDVAIREMTGPPRREDAYTLEYIGKLLEHLMRKEIDYRIHVGVPKQVVYAQILRNVKNFVVLFIASGFMAALFLNLLASLTDGSVIAASGRFGAKRGEESEAYRDLLLDLAKPIFFLSIFMEGLNVSFLPQYLKDIAADSGMGDGLASTVFTAFFAAYALILVPAGRYAESRGVKPLMIAGCALAALSMFLMVIADTFYNILMLRIMAGLGQGMLFIGVQSYILKVASDSRKTQGAAIIVFGYNGGMISGSAIGALLVINLDIPRIFTLAGFIGLFLIWYMWKLLPRLEGGAPVETKPSAAPTKVRELFGSLWALARDFSFVKTILLVGITTKAVLTGVAIFAIPLILSSQGYAKEDIGQIFMFYAAGVLLTSRFVSRAVDRVGKTDHILFWGTQGSGVGLMLIGLIGWSGLVEMVAIPNIATIALIAGMLILGLSHGFINAPIITHIANTRVAAKLGPASTTSIYRFMERIGHVSGPIIISQLLAMNGQSPLTISFVGIAVIGFGILFIISPSPKDSG